MQVKVTALTRQSAVISFNNNYALHSAIYALIEKSSSEYSRYLHDRGFINQSKNNTPTQTPAGHWRKAGKNGSYHFLAILLTGYSGCGTCLAMNMIIEKE